MTLTRALLAAALSAALAACASPPPKAEASRPGAIAAARSYGPRTGPAGSVPGPAGVAAPGWIAAAVTRELSARGLSERPVPDLDGVARVLVRGQPLIYARLGPRTNFPKFDRVRWPDGTLIVEFYSARTTDLVWRGIAEGLLKDGVTAEEIDHAVAAMFADWAPAQD